MMGRWLGCCESVWGRVVTSCGVGGYFVWGRVVTSCGVGVTSCGVGWLPRVGYLVWGRVLVRVRA